MKIIKGNFKNNPGEMNPAETEAKYSFMVFSLAEPFIRNEENIFIIEDIVEQAVLAWNMSVAAASNSTAYNEYLEESGDFDILDHTEVKTVKKMMDHKNRLYPDHHLFILYSSLDRSDNGGLSLAVTAGPIEDFIQIKEEEKEFSDFYDTPGSSAISITPKEVFWNWLRDADKDIADMGTYPSSTVYLIPEFMTDEPANAYLKKNYKRIFENQLEGQINDPSLWPKKRTFKLFEEFFEVSLHPVVADLRDEDDEMIL